MIDKIIEKTCNKCGQIKEINEFYSQDKKKADGTLYTYYRPDCKNCTNESSRKWIEENYEQFIGNVRKYISKPEVRERHKRESEERRKRGDFIEWRKNNRGKLKTYNEKRTHNKKHEISNEEWQECKEYFNNSCAYCGIDEDKAKHEMGHYLHKEHVDTLGSNKIDNCVPACRSCNSSKGSYEFKSWYKGREDIFNEERLNKIINGLMRIGSPLKINLYIIGKERLNEHL